MSSNEVMSPTLLAMLDMICFLPTGIYHASTAGPWSYA